MSQVRDATFESPERDPSDAGGPGAAGEQTRRRPWKRRTVKRLLGVLVAVVAAGLVSFLSIDLGRFPALISLAEREGSKFLDRSLEIGTIEAYLTPGVFALTKVVIAGKHAGDRPYFTADRIEIRVPWWTLLRRGAAGAREIHVNVTVDGWRMVVETWPNGVHNVPRFRRQGGGGGRLPFTTTVDFAYARNGHFVFEDHGTPWSVVAPNLNFSLVRSRLGQYVGLVGFSGGTTAIQSYVPMSTAMTARFELNGSKVRLHHLDLSTDGAVSHINGDIDFNTWPNQVYHVTSDIDFPRMKALFFARESWQLGGRGRFVGTFKIFKDGRDLSGEFSSDDARVNELEFPNLHGALQWTPRLFAVTHAEADLLGGRARFAYSLAPLGLPGGTTATFTADYTGVDLFELDRLMSLRGLKLAGAASGDLSLQWSNGRFGSSRHGVGRTRVDPPTGVSLAARTLPAVALPYAPEPTPFDPARRISPLLVGANTRYSVDPAGVTFGESWAATTHSFIDFSGRMASDGSSRFPFRVTSHDWQESDRLLASIMTAVSGPTNAVKVGGRGTFDGVMTGAFSAPSITGRFAGDAMAVWDVVWGRAVADLVIERGYVDITNAIVGDGPDRAIVPDGRFALGFRRDDQSEIAARVAIRNWPIGDLRHAFGLDDWPMAGTVAEATLDLSGQYRRMFGRGQMRIADGAAWNERFDTAVSDLELEGTGLRLNRLEIRKGGGQVRGAARIGWDGTYAFDAAGEGLAVETLDNFRIESAPLSGQLRFNVSGSGEFAKPSYSFDGSIEDLFVGSEGVGAVTGVFSISDRTMTIDRLVAASGRLQALGTGSIVFDEAYSSDLRFRFSETALDPYLKFLMTDDISPYTRVVVGGSVGIRGPLATPRALAVEAVVDSATLTLFDYDLRNDGAIRLVLESGRLNVAALKLAGVGTNLGLSGGADLERRTWSLTALGDSSLAILGLFPQFAGMTASGTARLNAALSGDFDRPRLAGEAVVTDGRIRPLNSPHSLEAINGRVEFGADAIEMRDVKGRIGTGDVTFGGRIPLEGYRLVEYDLTATGRSMVLRYPESFKSTVDMNLRLVGPVEAPRLTGSIDVLRVALVETAGTGAGPLGLAAAAGGSGGSGVIVETVPITEGTQLALDIRVTAPRLRFVDTQVAQLDGRADLDVRGTFNVPVITGTIDILGGNVRFLGNRYIVREGTIEFRADAVEPVYDISAETRPRVQGETIVVNLDLSGTFSGMPVVNITSEPSLPFMSVIQILFGGVPAIRALDQRAVQSPEELQQQMLQTVGAVLLASAVTSRLESVVEQTGLIDTAQFTPVLSDATSFQQQNPSARVTLVKQLRPRLYLTYSRRVGAGSDTQEEVILLEYDQSDLLSWVLSRNEDRTVALDFRLRYSF